MLQGSVSIVGPGAYQRTIWSPDGFGRWGL